MIFGKGSPHLEEHRLQQGNLAVTTLFRAKGGVGFANQSEEPT